MRLILFIPLLFSFQVLLAQNLFNDTLFYKSGWERTCKITKYDTKAIFFTYVNSKGEENETHIKRKKIKYFVDYSNENVLNYDSRISKKVITTAGVHTENLEFNDTLYYSSGEKINCFITRYNPDFVFYNYQNYTGGIEHTSVSTSKLNSFVICDSTDAVTFRSEDFTLSKFEADEDSLMVPKHILSFNPFSAAVLGLNTQFQTRFGEDYQFGIKIVARVLSPFLFGDIYSQFGAGFMFIPVDNERFSMAVGLVPSYALFQGSGLAYIPITFGIDRYITEKLTISGHIGMGPTLFSSEVLVYPTIHLGLGFQLGKKVMVNTGKITSN